MILVASILVLIFCLTDIIHYAEPSIFLFSFFFFFLFFSFVFFAFSITTNNKSLEVPSSITNTFFVLLSVDSFLLVVSYLCLGSWILYKVRHTLTSMSNVIKKARKTKKRIEKKKRKEEKKKKEERRKKKRKKRKERERKRKEREKKRKEKKRKRKEKKKPSHLCVC